MDNNFNIALTVTKSTHQVVIQILHDNWDSFYEVGVVRSILDFDFGIDTRDAKAVCYCQPAYGVCETKIVIEHITQLEDKRLYYTLEVSFTSRY